MTQTILCIDDERDYLDDLAEFLGSESFHVITASNASEGMERFLEKRPDLVLCDIRMPEMSGLEMFEQLQKQQWDLVCKTPFIYLTAWGDKEYHLAANALGSDVFLLKPVDFDVLLSTISSRLNRWRNHEAILRRNISHYQTAMMNMLNVQLRKPVENIISSAEILDEHNPAETRRYKMTVDYLARQHLKYVSAMADLIMLTLEQYPMNRQKTEATNMLWEAAVYGIGYEKASRIELEDPYHSIIPVDQNLCQKAFGNLIESVSRHAVGGVPFVSCKTRVHHNKVEFVIASSEARLKQDEHWVEVKDSAQLLANDVLMYQQGIQQLMMFEVARRQNMVFWIELSVQEDPANKLIMDV